MCNICGYITAQTDTAPEKKALRRLLIAGQVRGTDATGIGWLDAGAVNVYKTADPAAGFFKKATTRQVFDQLNAKIVIGHNRQATNGPTTDRHNNHPIFTKTGLALTHNGVISPTLAGNGLNLKQDGEVDSEFILRAIEHRAKTNKTLSGAISSAFSLFSGGATIALLTEKEPNTLYLAKRTNPLNLAYDKERGTIYYASTAEILKNGLLSTSYLLDCFPVTTGRRQFIFATVNDGYGLKIMAGEPIKKFLLKEPAYIIYGPVSYTYKTAEKNNQKKQKAAASEFDPTFEITKPSRISNANLLERLAELYFCIVQDNENGLLPTYWQNNEWRRIVQTLRARNYQPAVKIDLDPLKNTADLDQLIINANDKEKQLAIL